MKGFILILEFVVNIKSAQMYDTSNSYETVWEPTRRILKGTLVEETRPYMVYLRPVPGADKKFTERNWFCGGVIIHKNHILTSAACIEDVKQFYVISGTHTWVPNNVTNECIKNGAKRAVSKCVPKSYFFDGDEFDNIRWMVGDIAVVKVEDSFNFKRRIRGCDFIPKMIKYNNISEDYVKPNTVGTVAGWGSMDAFEDLDYAKPLQSNQNSVELLETDVSVISYKACISRWEKRYHFIIADEMICTDDTSDFLSSACKDHDMLCKGIEYSEENNQMDKQSYKQMIVDPSAMMVHTAAHRDETRRYRTEHGGFCENDHGGPLIIGHGNTALVVGIMSACLTKRISNKCYGPFLYTNVFKYRQLIACAIDIDVRYSRCNDFLRSMKTPIEKTIFEWEPNSQRKDSFNEQLITQTELVTETSPQTEQPIISLPGPIKETPLFIGAPNSLSKYIMAVPPLLEPGQALHKTSYPQPTTKPLFKNWRTYKIRVMVTNSPKISTTEGDLEAIKKIIMRSYIV